MRNGCSVMLALGLLAPFPAPAGRSAMPPTGSSIESSTTVTDRPPASGALRLSTHPSVRADSVAPFTSIGASFTSATSTVARVRVRRPDGTWDRWTTLDQAADEAPDRSSTEGAAARTAEPTEPLFVGTATGYEVVFPDDATELAVHRVENHIDRSTALTSTPEPTSADLASRLGAHRRSEWGARPPKIHPGIADAAKGMQIITIHHTAIPGNDYTAADAMTLVRNFQAYDMDVRNYDDLGYNMMVDKFGGIWEGRYGGIDQPVIGAHALGFNTVAWGIAVIGNYVSTEPPAAVIESLAKLAGWKLALEGHDPLSSVTIGADDAEGHPNHPVPLTTPRIVGHRDIGQTECPGGLLWNALQTIRTRAAAYAKTVAGSLTAVTTHNHHEVVVTGDVAPPPGARRAHVLVRIDRVEAARLDAPFSSTFTLPPGPHRICAFRTPTAGPPAAGLEATALIGCSPVTVLDENADPVRPTRVYDSRKANALRLGPPDVRSIAVAGVDPIPTGAAAVAANITVTSPAADGFLTVYPCGESRPTGTSSVNFAAGQTIAALALTKLDATGHLCLYASALLDVIVDVTAWFPAGGAFDAVPPTRLLDTRIGKRSLASGHELIVPVASRAGVPAGAAAVALNVVAVDPRRDGWLSVYPCDTGRGSTSTVNFKKNRNIANLTVTRLAADGTVCVYADGGTDVIIDVTGGFPSNGVYVPIAPTRIMDTRAALMLKRLKEDDTNEVDIRGRAGIPADAVAVVANLTITNPEKPGFATLYPCAEVWPGTSNVNYGPGESIPNLTFTRIGTNGCLRLYNEMGTDAIVDVVGYLEP